MESCNLLGCHVTRLITQSFLRHPWISTSASRDDFPTIPSKQLHTASLIVTMFTVRWPSLPSLGLFSSLPTQAIDLPPVNVHETETAQDKPARAFKHLLKLNHVENSLFDCRNFPNQLIHVSHLHCLRNKGFLCMHSSPLVHIINLLAALELLLFARRRRRYFRPHI